MIKKYFGMVAGGAAMAIGALAGQELYHTIRNPYKRARIKKKIKNVKNALKKEKKIKIL